MDNKKYILLLLTFLPLLTLLILWNSLPDQIPIHWNVNGEIDRYGAKYLVILIILPGYLLTRLAAQSIPDHFKVKWERISVFLMIFLNVISISILVAGLGYTVPMIPITVIGLVSLSIISFL